MKILGNTPEGDLIIQVSQAEWDGLRDGIRPPLMEFFDTEVYRTLKGKKLPGVNWLSLKKLFDKGCIDGTVRQLRKAIADREVYLYGLSFRQRSLDKIYAALLDEQA